MEKMVMRKTDKGFLVMPTEIYSRVVGYYRPVNQWNNSKQAEFENRKEYDANQKKA